ncbi:hypothetical protein DITRI_Ditri15bG0015900 [Diplodiscus trichospermus]
MAEAVISAAVEVTLSKAISVVEKQINLQWDFKEELNKLHDSLTMTHAFLRDAGRRKVHDEPVQVWLKQLRKIAYEADDVLDELAYEDLRRKVETQTRKKVSNFFSITKNPIVFSSNMLQTVKGINISLDEINDRALKFGLQQRVHTQPPLSGGSPTTHFFGDSSHVVGREADVSKIVDLLIGSSTRQAFSITSIVGMGGLGKTTLAKSVCNNERIKNSFDKIMWVCVSENFDVERILQEMFESLTGETCDMKNRSAMLEKIQKELEGKAYLLALDDVWDEDIRNWDDLKGFPLVANVIGGTMSNKWDIDEWVAVRDSSHWDSLRNEGIVGVLKLNFDRLPSPSLKQCFAYCSVFPKNFTIKKEQLIQLWLAEGFLQQTEGKTFEDIGNEYFNSLLSNSLLQDVEKDRCGSITCCKMHDFVHDLAQSIRNLETDNASHNQPKKEFDGMKLWHSLFSKSNFFRLEADFKNLQVLNFSGADISVLPESICRLKHLRYFDFSNTYLLRLPKSITHLYHLQTLRLLRCHDLEELPQGMKNLVSLRHLYVDDPIHVFEEIGCVTNLQTLPIFDVGIESRSRIEELGCLSELGGELKIYNLQDIRNENEARRAKIWEKKKLRTLRYEWDDKWKGYNRDEEVLEGLEPHSNLKSLTIKNYYGESNPSWLPRKRVTTSFQLINLVELKLSYCKNLRRLPTLGQYPNLKFLEIRSLFNVKHIEYEFYMNDSGNKNESTTLFPALEKFTISGMRKVKQWLDVEPTIAVFPLLKELRIEECENISRIPVMSRFSSLEILTVRKCKKLSLIGEGLFPSTLKILEIKDCRQLSSVPGVEGGISFLQELHVTSCDELSKIGEGVLASSCLRGVSISYCFNLRFIPLNLGSQSLLKLQLKGCDELREIEGGLSACTGLENLCIEDCPNLISIPRVVGFSSLSRLTLRNCRRLRKDVGQLRSLRDLSITYCQNLKRFPEESLGCLTCLETLELGAFSEELEEFPGLSSIHRLHSSLEDLTLFGWETLSSLPDQFQHLTALEILGIEDFSGLRALPEWLRKFSSLRKLFLRDCENLRHLPSRKAMRCLSKLQKVSITNCPLLKKNRAERSKISRIRRGCPEPNQSQ